MSIVNEDKAETVYFLTTPKAQAKFPIAVACEGSSTEDDLESVWRLHQYSQKGFDGIGPT